MQLVTFGSSVYRYTLKKKWISNAGGWLGCQIFARNLYAVVWCSAGFNLYCSLQWRKINKITTAWLVCIVDVLLLVWNQCWNLLWVKQFPFAFHQFVHINNLKLICRAHQLVHEGYKYMFDETLVTVWSAPNYCYRCGNIASILAFSDADTREPKLFKAVPDCDRVIPPRTTTPYFL